MKRILAILNLVAAIPMVTMAIGLFLVTYVAEPIDESGALGIIGGAEGPTSIFITNEPAIYAPWVVLLYVALLACNAVAFWKGSSTEHPSGPYFRKSNTTP